MICSILLDGVQELGNKLLLSGYDTREEDTIFPGLHAKAFSTSACAPVPAHRTRADWSGRLVSI